MTEVLALRGATKRYGGTVAVRDVSLALSEGEFVALLGASGCGKSTTLRMMAGLEAPTEGRAVLRGRDVTGEGAAARNVALMFQSYALYPHLTVRQNLAMPLRLRRMSPLRRLPVVDRLTARGTCDAIDRKVHETAAALRIEALLDRRPGQLSGGQQQRVALARALVREPSAFLLDEPLSNLDTQLRGTARDEIKALHRRGGPPFLLVTHDQSDALAMADRVAVMIDGRIVQVDTPQALFAAPRTRAVAEFIGQHRMNVLPAGPAAALDPAGARLAIGVRPDALSLAPGGPLEVVVTGVAFHGEETLVTLRGPGTTPLRLVMRGAPPPETGATVRLSAAAGALHGFDADGLRRSLT